MSCAVPGCDGRHRVRPTSLWAMEKAWRADDDDAICRGHRLAELEAMARFDVARQHELDELDPERVLRREAARQAALRAELERRGPRTWSGAGSNYGVAALAGIVGDLSALAPEEGSGRNHALNRAAYAIAGLVAGGELDGPTALRAVRDAADLLKVPRREAQTAIRSGWESGLKRPRLIERRAA